MAGIAYNYRNRMNLRLGDKFVTTLNVNYNHLELENGTIDALVSGAQLTYCLPANVSSKFISIQQHY